MYEENNNNFFENIYLAKFLVNKIDKIDIQEDEKSKILDIIPY